MLHRREFTRKLRISVGSTRFGSSTQQGRKSWFKQHTIRALIWLYNSGRTLEIYIWYIIQHNSLFEGVTYAKQDDIRSQESVLHIAELITMTVLKSGRKRINSFEQRVVNEFQQLEYKRRKKFTRWNEGTWVAEESLHLGYHKKRGHLEWVLATVIETKWCVSLAYFQQRDT